MPNNSTETQTKLELPPLKGKRRLILIRHGQTDWNRRGLVQGGGHDIPINEDGRDQARKVAQTLQTLDLEQPVVIASSHMKRASETADIVAESLDLTVSHRMEDLGEMRFGSLEGVALRGPESTTATRQLYNDSKEKMVSNADLQWSGGGESTRQVSDRMVRAYYKLCETNPRTILAVAHGRSNKIFLATLLHGDMQQFAQVEQDNTCINVLDEQEDGSFQECIVNYVGHLEE